MDLSLIVLAMLKMSSNERLPLCLTERNYVNITTKRNMKAHKPTIKKKELATKINLVDKRKLTN
jgi:putative heme iron utilization protein